MSGHEGERQQKDNGLLSITKSRTFWGVMRHEEEGKDC